MWLCDDLIMDHKMYFNVQEKKGINKLMFL